MRKHGAVLQSPPRACCLFSSNLSHRGKKVVQPDEYIQCLISWLTSSNKTAEQIPAEESDALPLLESRAT